MKQATFPVPEEGVCRYFVQGVCRSCGLLELPYRQQLERKQQQIAHLFVSERFGKVTLLPPVACPHPAGSRTRVKMAIGGYAHAPLIGLADERCQVQELLDCPLHHPAINRVLEVSVDLIRQAGLPPYQISRKKGELKFLLVHHAAGTGQTLVRLVVRSRHCLERVRRYAERVRVALPSIVCVSANIQPLHAAVLEGPEELIVSGGEEIEELFAGTRILFPPHSFCQVTSGVAEKLYAYVAEVVSGSQCLMDLYCGAGAFSLVAAPHCGKSIGIEISPAAVRAAQRSAQMNGLSHVHFECADVDAFLARSPAINPDTVICNPPRRGLSEGGLAQIGTLAPRTIVYSSCNPATLERDLMRLIPAYRLKSIRAFDMFPWTEHVETVAVLELS